MVKISDMETSEEYGIENLPAVVYFENGIPFVYMGIFLHLFWTKLFLFVSLSVPSFSKLLRLKEN